MSQNKKRVSHFSIYCNEYDAHPFKDLTRIYETCVHEKN